MAGIRFLRIGAFIVLALAALLVAASVYAIVASRTGAISYITAFTMLRWIAQIGAAVFIASLAVFIVSLATRRAGSRTKLLSGAAAAVTLVLVGTMVTNQAAPPPGPLMNDITTDLEDPPQFEAVVPLRPRSSNPVEYGGAETAANQREVHPEVVPIETALSPEAAFERAHAVAQSMGWEIVSADPDRGIIEAVDTTPFFRFKDDVVIRVRETPDGSRVDLRSLSRIGRSDLGKNADRIMEFSRAFDAAG